MALVREPELLLLDEPLAALDALTRLRIHALVTQLRRRHQPSVVIEQRIVPAPGMGEWDGHVLGDPPAEDIREQPPALLGVQPTV